MKRIAVSSVWLIERWLNRVVREPEVGGMTAYESPVLGEGQVTFDQVRPLSGRLPDRPNILFQVRIMVVVVTITLIDVLPHIEKPLRLEVSFI